MVYEQCAGISNYLTTQNSPPARGLYFPMQLKFSDNSIIKIPTGANAVVYLRKHYGQRYAVEYVQYLERQKAALRAIDAHIEKNALHL